MTSPVEESSRVVREVIESGAFDGLRKTVFEELKQSVALREYVREQVENSKTLSGDCSKAQKERTNVLKELQAELKDRLVERASRVVWEILTNSEGRIAQDIEHTVHETLCRIYEREREKQQQQPASVDRVYSSQSVLPAVEGGVPQQVAVLPPRPGGAAPTASLAGQPHQQQQQQQRPPPRHYGVYGQS